MSLGVPIERVREWARSTRGGRQLQLLDTAEHPAPIVKALDGVA